MSINQFYKLTCQHLLAVFSLMSCFFLGIQTTNADDTQLEKNEKITPPIEEQVSKQQIGKQVLGSGLAIKHISVS